MLLTLETLYFRLYLIIFANLISESYLVLFSIWDSLILGKGEEFSLLIGHLYLFLSAKLSVCVHCWWIYRHQPPLSLGKHSITLSSGTVWSHREKSLGKCHWKFWVILNISIIPFFKLIFSGVFHTLLWPIITPNIAWYSVRFCSKAFHRLIYQILVSTLWSSYYFYSYFQKGKLIEI